MFGRRNATKDVFRAVVMAGAMLGMTACGSSSTGKTTEKPATMEKKNPCADTNSDEKKNPCANTATPDEKKNPCGEIKNPCANKQNPCGKRNPCEGGPKGRGFILA